jgi:hypothetical protein
VNGGRSTGGSKPDAAAEDLVIDGIDGAARSRAAQTQRRARRQAAVALVLGAVYFGVMLEVASLRADVIEATVQRGMTVPEAETAVAGHVDAVRGCAAPQMAAECNELRFFVRGIWGTTYVVRASLRQGIVQDVSRSGPHWFSRID